MKLVNILMIALMLIAGASLAGEKVVDTQNATPTLNTKGLLSGSLTEDSPTYDRIFGGSVSLDCASEVMDSSQNSMFFALFCIEVSNADPIELIVDPSATNLHDTVMTLYCDPFDSTLPEANVVSFDDDGGDGLLSAFTVNDNITLTVGNTYWVVLSTFGAGDDDDMGDFAIMTSDNVTECGTVATESGSWDSLKASYR